MPHNVETFSYEGFSSILINEYAGKRAVLAFLSLSQSAEHNPFLEYVGLKCFRNEGVLLKSAYCENTSFYLKAGIVGEVWFHLSGIVDVKLDYNRSVGFSKGKFILIDPSRSPKDLT